MCIAVFLWKAHPLCRLYLLQNRDEYHDRPSDPLRWWDDRGILGGRDCLAGGTWLACSRRGRVAFVTNVREVTRLDQPRSRGDLPVRFLENSTGEMTSLGRLCDSVWLDLEKSIVTCATTLLQSARSPLEFAEEVLKDSDQYNGFNLIVADVAAGSMLFITNRPGRDGVYVSEVSPGIHVLSNASLDTPWPKGRLLRCGFEELIEEKNTGEIPDTSLAVKLMMNRTKDDKNLPGVLAPEWEYKLSSVFVEANTPSGLYGTRSISALFVRTNGEVKFHELYLDNGEWKELDVSYKIEQSA